MESVKGHSAACCNIPPIISKGYESKGKYETIGGLKTYVTGPSSAKRAVLMIYDIFGYFPQTLQGADIMATYDKDHSYQVFMPDFFEGEPADLAWYPPVTEEQKKAMFGWFSTRGPQIAVTRIPKVLADIEAVYGEKTWAALGFCWGGKVVSLTSSFGTAWKVGAQCHPGMIDSADAAKVTIPIMMLASKDEDSKEVTEYEKALPAKIHQHVEIFDSQIHGWMSARADLDDGTVRKEYERGYETVLEFFGKHM